MGNSTKERLKSGGITARTRDSHHVLLTDIHFPPVGHPLHHARGDDPLDEDLIADIMTAQEIREVITVRDDGAGKDGKLRFTIIDGARRTRNGAEAERRLHKSGALAKDAHIFAPLRFFKGTDAEALKERLRLNADPLKKADRPSVLAATLIALDKLHEPLESVIASLPRAITAKVAKALLSWPNLARDLREQFDDKRAPIGLLPAVLDVVPEERAGVLTSLMAAGVREPKATTRVRNVATGKSPRPKALARPVGLAMATRLEGEGASYKPADVAALVRYLLGDREQANGRPWLVTLGTEAVKAVKGGAT